MNYWGIFFSFILAPALILGAMVVAYKTERRE